LAEHRNVMDPSVLHRIASNMESIAEAWQADIDALHAETDRANGLERELNTTMDRASNLQADLRSTMERLEGVIYRNAFLEAQVQRLRDTSLDARDTLAAIASQAEQVAHEESAAAAPARAAAPLAGEVKTEQARVVPPQPEPTQPSHDDEDDGSGLPPGTPEFLRTPLPDGVDFSAPAPVRQVTKELR